MTEQEVKAMFTLAGIEVLKIKKLANGYCHLNCCWDKYWWFVKTKAGWVEIGWRKRVISIDWSETNIIKSVTADDVTKGIDHVHAHSTANAIEYLTNLGVFINAEWN